jgi:hypothetical protein
MTGFGTAVVLLLLPSIVRYGQEARPYGLVLLVGTLSWWAWWRWQERQDRTRALGYALTVTLLPLVNLLALTLVLAQILAALARTNGWRRAGATALAALAGLFPVFPFILIAVRHAHGIAHPLPSTVQWWWWQFAGSFSSGSANDPRTWWIAALMFSLAALGLIQLRDPPRRDLVILAAAWAFIPPVVLGLLSTVRPTLIQRYFLVAMPGWAILAVQGLTVLVLVARWMANSRRGLTTVAAVPVIALAVLAFPAQVRFRTATGHGNGDIRPVLSLINSPGMSGLPVVVLPHMMAIIPVAYEPDLYARMPLAQDPARSRRILQPDLTGDPAFRSLADVSTLALIYFGTPEQARACLTDPRLSAYQVSNEQHFERWTVLTLVRISAPVDSPRPSATPYQHLPPLDV